MLLMSVRIQMSEKGYSSQVIGKQWMQTVFDPQTKDIADGCTHLLIVDGHSSHFSYDLLDYSMFPLVISLLFVSHHTQPMLSKLLMCLVLHNSSSTMDRYLMIVLMMALVQ